jgi:hypothetical protein
MHVCRCNESISIHVSNPLPKLGQTGMVWQPRAQFGQMRDTQRFGLRE